MLVAPSKKKYFQLIIYCQKLIDPVTIFSANFNCFLSIFVSCLFELKFKYCSLANNCSCVKLVNCWLSIWQYFCKPIPNIFDAILEFGMRKNVNICPSFYFYLLKSRLSLIWRWRLWWNSLEWFQVGWIRFYYSVNHPT